MKIIIDVSEKDYNAVKGLPKIGAPDYDCLLDNIYEAVRNGKVITEQDDERSRIEK